MGEVLCLVRVGPTGTFAIHIHLKMSDDLWTNITWETLGISPPSSQTHLVSFVFPKCHINEPKINKVLKVKVTSKTFFVGRPNKQK